MSNLDETLGETLAVIQADGLRRELRRIDSPQAPRIEVNGQTFLNFSSNDYLGLANHPELKTAAIEAIQEYGAGSGASRLICGSLAPHAALEERLADFKGTAAALTFSSGYATALGTICALVTKGDLIILDRLAHASMVDAARLSGAKIRVFAHNDLEDLEQILKWAAAQGGTAEAAVIPNLDRKFRGVLIVTESVFSMDGDLAPLRQLVELKQKYGAWLMVDEAHSTGLYGAHGSGLAEAEGVKDQIEVQMGTLGKALGASGGYIAGSRVLIDYLVNRARSFVFSTAPVPAAVAAATAAIDLVQGPLGAERRDLLWQRAAQTRTGFASLATQELANEDHRPLGPNWPHASAILPLMVGNEAKAVQLAADLRREGIFVPAIRFPTVARNQARLRVTVTAAHDAAQVDQLLNTLRKLQAF